MTCWERRAPAAWSPRYATVPETAVGLRGSDAGARLEAVLTANPDVRDTIVSVGIPILMPDGKRYLRGPEIKIPGYDPAVAPWKATAGEIDGYAAKGWVDLRSENLLRWADRLDQVVATRRVGSAVASDAMSHESYGRDDFRIGEVVAWIFANEPEFNGYRIK